MSGKRGLYLAGLGGIAALASGLLVWKRLRGKSDAGAGVAVRAGEGPVRNAGPEGMRSEVRRAWTQVDQASDESFPASDPPGQGVG